MTVARNRWRRIAGIVNDDFLRRDEDIRGVFAVFRLPSNSLTGLDAFSGSTKWRYRRRADSRLMSLQGSNVDSEL